MNYSLQNLETKQWIYEHRVAPPVMFVMEKYVTNAPKAFFHRPIKSILRWAYTQALRELKHVG